MVITNSSRATMDVADYVMITWLHSDAAQAAILPAQIMMWTYIVIGVGIVAVVNTFVSQSLGRNLLRECSAYGWQSIYIALAFGLVGEALRPMLPGLIASFGHDPAVQEMEYAYSRVALFAVAPTIIGFGLGWYFVGIHRPRITMWSTLEANLVNIVVSYVLMFGTLGNRPMGIAGAAWGTLIALSYRAARLMFALLTGDNARLYHSRHTWMPSWGKLKDLFRVGLPCAVNFLCDLLVWAVFVNLLIGKKFGTEHLIATNTAWQYMRVAFLPVFGAGQALQALVGKSIGAGDPQRAVQETRVAVRLALGYLGALSALYTVFGATLIGWFNSAPEVIRIGYGVMICAACFQLFDGLGIIYGSALRGAGDTFIPSVFFIFSSWLIIVSGGWTVATWYPQFGSLGPWATSSLLIAIVGVFLRWRWRGGAWRKIALFGEAKATS